MNHATGHNYLQVDTFYLIFMHTHVHTSVETRERVHTPNTRERVYGCLVLHVLKRADINHSDRRVSGCLTTYLRTTQPNAS